MTRITVDVRDDHLQRLARADAISGLAELVWNALDAEALTAQIHIEKNALGGVAEVVVEDDGLGMTFDRARSGFESLGGSWKRTGNRRSQNDLRALHGSAGQGRWKAFSLGDEVEWVSVAQLPDGSFERVRVHGSAQHLNEFDLADPVPCDGPAGTTVRLLVGTRMPAGLQGDQVADALSAKLALYLQAYPTVRVFLDGVLLDPASVQTRTDDYTLDVADVEGEATLTVIEWARKFDRGLYLCDANGNALEKVEAGIQAPGFEFTAYVRWEGFRTREGELLIAELDGDNTRPVIEAARDKLRDHFRGRREELQAEVLENWKREDSYPYIGEPADVIEQAEREIFDVVAVTAASAINSAQDVRSKKLSLRLIREAVERNPGSLRRIFQEVLELPPQKVEELVDLLDRTSLSSIIASAHLISGRLDFLRGLEILLFDPVSKKVLLERRQLHRILAAETWIFGEEFALTADDDSLTTVLRKYVGELDRDELAPEPLEDVPDGVTDEEGRQLIVDLMLSRSMEQARNRREHLVVELKRPLVKVGPKEISQIENYALAVAQDERFHESDVQWDFVVVSNELTKNAEAKTRQQGQPVGLVSAPLDGKVRVWARTWAQVIEDAQHRLKYVQQGLGYRSDDRRALEYLRSVHAKYLPAELESAAVVT